jgi:hypothetical protein
MLTIINAYAPASTITEKNPTEIEEFYNLLTKTYHYIYINQEVHSLFHCG